MNSHNAENVMVEINSNSRESCRLCDSKQLIQGYDFGKMPIANELASQKISKWEEFPLNFCICQKCGLGQLIDDVNPKRLFEDYRYTSSTSSTMLAHVESFVQQIKQTLEFGKDDYILEIASNDGYLIKQFSKIGIKCVGVEPAKNIVSRNEENMTIINAFFDETTAAAVYKTYGHPRLIIANNVLAHVPDIKQFMRAIRSLAGQNTLISIENPKLSSILLETQFDTIYHEHFSYLSVSSVQLLASISDLKLMHVQNIIVHGGSARYFLSIKNSNSFGSKFANNVKLSMEIEKNFGILSEKRWTEFRIKTDNSLSTIAQWFKEHENEVNVGFGAAAKASTLLNAINIQPNQLSAIGDSSLEKIGKFMPREFIPIVDINHIKSLNPQNIVVFPWNLKQEICQNLQKNGLQKSNYWIFHPSPNRILL